jgi:hypothetical protein
LLLALPGVVVMVPPLPRLACSPVGRRSTETTLGTETHRSECEYALPLWRTGRTTEQAMAYAL